MCVVSATNRVRGVLAGVLVGLSAAVAPAQFTPDVPPPPKSLFQVQAGDPPPVLKLNDSVALPPPKAVNPPADVGPPPPGTPLDTLSGPVLADRPLPGSVQDEYEQELQARRDFTRYTWRGARITFLPNSLLWEPPLAVKKDPKMQFLATSLANYRSEYTVDTWIGGTQGLFRFEPEGADFAAQLDIFGLVQTRLSPDDLLAADYRFGLPVSWRWGWWQGKIGYEHTSAHLGDELILRTGRQTRSFAKDEVVLGIGRIVEDNLRVYGHIGYAFSFQVPDVESSTRNRMRYDVGAEWLLRCPTGWMGSPFAAANLEWRGDQGYTPNWTLQAGWLWRNPLRREGMVRVFGEYYTGRSPYGQFLQTREQFYSVGFGFDF
jgi:hypothetical protein